MRLSANFLRISRLVVGLSLCCIGSARAGNGGANGTFQSILNEVCAEVGMTSCPQLPTITQLILEISGLIDAWPDMIRYNYDLLSGATVTAGNPPVQPARSAIVLSSLTPLAFISAQTDKEQAAATHVYDKDADTFFFAVISTEKAIPQPDTLDLIYARLPWTSRNFLPGQRVGDISLPLVVLNSNGTEHQVPTTMQV
jgi:hypothetical protein